MGFIMLRKNLSTLISLMILVFPSVTLSNGGFCFKSGELKRESENSKEKFQINICEGKNGESKFSMEIIPSFTNPDNKVIGVTKKYLLSVFNQTNFLEKHSDDITWDFTIKGDFKVFSVLERKLKRKGKNKETEQKIAHRGQSIEISLWTVKYYSTAKE